MKELFLLIQKWFLPLFLTTAVVAVTTGVGVGLYKAKKTQIPSNALPTRQEASQIKIIDGNICLVGVDGRVKILVDKIHWQAVPIDYFSDVSVSPDGTKMCFLAHTVQPVWLFWSKIDGSNVIKVEAVAKNCVWSNDSRKIAFNNQTSDVSQVDVYVYDTQTDKIKNLTESVNQSDTIIRAYKQPEWADGDTKIIGKYIAFQINDPANQTEGFSSINLSTGEIEDH